MRRIREDIYGRVIPLPLRQGMPDYEQAPTGHEFLMEHSVAYQLMVAEWRKKHCTPTEESDGRPVAER